MANYPDIKGFNIQSKSTDPVPFANEKTNNPWVGTWASVSGLNTGRAGLGGAGTTTGALAFAGNRDNPPSPFTNVTEKWNGTSWTEVADLNQIRYEVGGVGASNSAALMLWRFLILQPLWEKQKNTMELLGRKKPIKH